MSPAGFTKRFLGTLPSLPQTPTTITGQTRPRGPPKHEPPPDACRWRGAAGPACEPGPVTQPARLRFCGSLGGFCFSHPSARFLQHEVLVSLPLSQEQRNLPQRGRLRGSTQETLCRSRGHALRGRQPCTAELRPPVGSSPVSGRWVKDKCTNQQTGSTSAEGPAVAQGGDEGGVREAPFPVGLGFSKAQAVECTCDLVLACSKFSWDKLHRV